ncbi:MAG: hypothetical protein CM1200mP18_01800 [Gammaproteobacteria bacterium]|nr:MAG: hypothetical protein CM1200mP18_01800 [Gammaproteobacteria bacterium]
MRKIQLLGGPHQNPTAGRHGNLTGKFKSEAVLKTFRVCSGLNAIFSQNASGAINQRIRGNFPGNICWHTFSNNCPEISPNTHG